MINQLYIFRNIKDNCLHWIEKTASRLSYWAWDKRFKARDPNEWIKGYNRWKEGKNEK